MLFQGERQDKKSGLKRNYLYLNTCTTEDQMVNPSYLTKIHKASKPLTLHTNAGSSSTTHKGYLGSELFWLDCFGTLVCFSDLLVHLFR